MPKYKGQKVTEDADLKKEKQYPMEWEEDIFDVRVIVNDPYTIENGVIVSSLKWGDAEERESKTLNYNPFEVEYLFEKVERINTNSHKSILNFCNKYGTFNTIDTMPFYYGLRLLDCQKQRLDEFIHQVNEIKHILQIHEAINNKNEDLLQEHTLIFKEDFKNIGYLYGNDKDIFELSRKWTIIKINQQTEGIVSPIGKMGKNNESIKAYTSRSLLGVIYHQLLDLTTNGWKLKKCTKCKSKFVPRTDNSRFCPPDEPGKDSLCKTAYNQWIRHARIDYFSGKKTIEQIVQQKKRPLAEVEGWIESADKEKWLEKYQ